MDLDVKNFENTLGRAREQGRLDHAFKLGGKGGLQLNRPVKPPGGWTRFIAYFSGWPLLKNMEDVRRARARVDNYTLELGNAKISNRQVMQSFMQCLQKEFGNGIANMVTTGMDGESGRPLTSRTVSMVIDKARQQTRAMKARNNLDITKFLENGRLDGTGGRPGGMDMIGLLLDAGIDLKGKDKWQDALPGDLAKGLEKLFRLKCREMPGYSKGILPNADLAKAGREVVSLLKEVLDLTSVDRDELVRIISTAAKGAATSKEMMANIHRGIAQDTITRLTDPGNPGSLFSTLDKRINKMEGQTPIPHAVRKEIIETVCKEVIDSKDLPGLLGCGTGPKEIAKALPGYLEKGCEKALKGHLKALKMIDAMTGISKEQRRSLKQLAATKRLDTEQVTQFEKYCAWGKRIKSLVTNLGGGQMKKVVDGLKILVKELKSDLAACGKMATSLGCGGTSRDIGNRVRDLVKVSLAGLSGEELKEILAALTGKNARDLAAVLGFVPGGKDLGRGREIITHLALGIGDMLGMDTDAIAKAFRVGKDDPSPPSRILLGVFGGLGDKKGMDPDFPTTKGVMKKEFDLEKFRERVKNELPPFVTDTKKWKIDPGTGLGSDFIKDADRATFRMDGWVLPKDKEGFFREFKDTLKKQEPQRETEKVEALGRCLSRLMNQTGVTWLRNRFMETALGGPLLPDRKYEDSLGYDARRDGRGNWMITAYHVSNSNMLVVDSGDHPLNPESSVCFVSVTYKIPKDSIDRGKPQVQIMDSAFYLSLDKGKTG